MDAPACMTEFAVCAFGLAPNNVNKHYGNTLPCSSSASQIMGAVESNFGAFGDYSAGPFSLRGKEGQTDLRRKFNQAARSEFRNRKSYADQAVPFSSGQFGAAYGDFALGGTRQGIPGSTSASQSGVVGVLTDAGVNAVSSPGSVLSGVTGVATELGEEGLAGPVGWAKLGIDGAVFAGAVAYCTNHP
jgi:hypothetical protein